MRTQLSWLAIAGALSVVVTSCTGSPQSPTSPSAAAGGTTFARSDPATLKIDAPKVVSPTDDELIDTRRPNLIWVNPTGKYAAMGLAYEIELRDASRHSRLLHLSSARRRTSDRTSYRSISMSTRPTTGRYAGSPTRPPACRPGPGPSPAASGRRNRPRRTRPVPRPARRTAPSARRARSPFNEAWNIIMTIHNVRRLRSGLALDPRPASRLPLGCGRGPPLRTPAVESAGPRHQLVRQGRRRWSSAV